MDELYIVLKNLDYKGGIVPKGTVMFLDLPRENLDILVNVGAISPFGTPPFDVLPGWRYRAKRLKRNGITVTTFLYRNDQDLAHALSLPTELVRRWRRELKTALGVDPDISPRGKSG